MPMSFSDDTRTDNVESNKKNQLREKDWYMWAFSLVHSLPTY